MMMMMMSNCLYHLYIYLYLFVITAMIIIITISSSPSSFPSLPLYYRRHYRHDHHRNHYHHHHHNNNNDLSHTLDLPSQLIFPFQVIIDEFKQLCINKTYATLPVYRYFYYYFKTLVFNGTSISKSLCFSLKTQLITFSFILHI